MVLHSAAMMMGHSYPPLTVGMSPPSLNTSDTSSTVTSGQATVLPAGGSGLRTYAWVYVAGDSPIQPVSPGSAVTAFRASLGAGSQASATWKCVVTDTVTQQVVDSPNLVISLSRGYPPLSASAGTAHAAVSSQTPINISPGTTASVAGGSPPYSYSWSNDGGFNTLPSGNVCYFGASAVPPATTRTGTGYLTVTDSNGQPAYASFSIIAENTATAPSPVTLSVDNSSLGAFGNNGYAATETPATFTVSGGVGPFTISVTRTGGVGSIGSPSGSGRSHSTGFSASGIPWQSTLDGSFQATVYDHGTTLGSSAGVSVIFYNFGTGGGPIS